MKKRNVKLNWMNMPPPGGRKIALLIPQYNESRNSNFLDRMRYFMALAKKYENFLDVIIIDDGSGDDSLDRMVDFININRPSFYLVSVWPNAQKVGALHAAAAVIDHKYVILSDFDTDLKYLRNLEVTLKQLDEDPQMIGCYFKMIPFEGKGKCFLFQQMEYSFARMYYKFHGSEQSVPVMPGAGSCFKRERLLKVYRKHSGFRNGEDREATIIGLNMGYKTLYAKNVLALTRPPLTFKALVVQRKRWYLGYIETFFKERKFYQSMMAKGKRIGLRTLQDGIGILLLLLMPLELGLLAAINEKITAWVVPAIYLISVVYYFTLFLSHKDERTEIKWKDTWNIALYPLFWLSISFMAWWKAVLAFRRNMAGKDYEPDIFNTNPKHDWQPEYFPSDL